MQHSVFAAFFIVQNKLHRHARLAWPLGLRRVAAMAAQVAGVMRVGGVAHDGCGDSCDDSC